MFLLFLHHFLLSFWPVYGLGRWYHVRGWGAPLHLSPLLTSLTSEYDSPVYINAYSDMDSRDAGKDEVNILIY